MSSPKVLALGRLRRDTMILGAGNAKEMEQLAKAATTEGRAAEVFLISIVGYASEKEHDFSAIDTFTVTGRGQPGGAQTPALNPGAGPQPPSVEEKTQSELEPTSIAAQIEKNAQEGPKGPDTGTADARKEEAKGAAADEAKIAHNLDLEAAVAAKKAEDTKQK